MLLREQGRGGLMLSCDNAGSCPPCVPANFLLTLTMLQPSNPHAEHGYVVDLTVVDLV